jgi:hypothetical protein
VLLLLIRGTTTVTERRQTITIQGSIKRDSLDALLVSHRLTIVGTDGHVYEVEPTYLGAYLQRCEGCGVIARAELLRRGEKRSVVRVLSLKLMGRTPVDRGKESAA